MSAEFVRRRAERYLFTESIVDNFAPNNPSLAEALRVVDRRQFLPNRTKNRAYKDDVIQLGNGSSISQPSLVVKMIDLLGLTGAGRVLDIGTASGYTAALLSRMAEQVYSVEYNAVLAKHAATRLRRLGYSNIEVSTGDGVLGLPERSPFDAILVSAAARKIPPTLFDQLTEGGRIVLPVGKDPINVSILLALKYRGMPLSYPVSQAQFHPLMSEAEGGWTEQTLDLLWKVKKRIFDGSLEQQGKTVEQFRAEHAESQKVPIEEIDIDSYIKGMRISDELLVLFDQLLDQEKNDQRTDS